LPLKPLVIAALLAQSKWYQSALTFPPFELLIWMPSQNCVNFRQTWASALGAPKATSANSVLQVSTSFFITESPWVTVRQTGPSWTRSQPAETSPELSAQDV